MNHVELIDSHGDQWVLLLPCIYEKQRNGLTIMWAHVSKGPTSITRWYPQIPIPIFTEWWT